MESESPALEEGLIHDGSREATLRKWGDVGDEQALLWIARSGIEEAAPVKHTTSICSTVLGPTQAVVGWPRRPPSTRRRWSRPTPSA